MDQDREGNNVNVQFNNVRMSQQLEVLNLTLDTTSHVAADQLLASNDLEGDLLSGAIVDGELDLAERAFAQGADNLVGADALLRLDLFL